MNKDLNRVSRDLSLKLHTDLTTLSDYADNPAIMREVIFTAEQKLFQITAYLAELRQDLGMTGSRQIIEAVRS